MRRLPVIAASVAAVALLVPAASGVAKSGNGAKAKSNAVALCAKERKTVGIAAFAEKYGSPAMPGCKRFVKKLTRSAAKQCKQERRAMGRDAFGRKYASKGKRRNAFGKCVSAKVKESLGEVCPDDLIEEPDEEGEEFGEEEGEELEEEEGEEPGGEEFRLARSYASCDDGDGEDAEEDAEGDLEDETDEDF